MAIVTQGFKGSVKLVDAGGNVSILRPDVEGASFAAALTNLQSLVAAIDALTDALVAGYSLSEVYAEDTAQYGTGEVENIAEVVVPLETAGKYHTFKIPAPVAAMFVGASGPDYNKVNTSYAGLLTYIGLHTDKTGYGTPGADAISLVSDGEKVKPDNTNSRPFIENGKRIHRASRKG